VATNPQKQAVIRKIAADAVHRFFGPLPDDEGDELITSIMRQWLTSDRHAVLIKDEERRYLHLQEVHDEYTLVEDTVQSDTLRPFLRDWCIDAELAPSILHDLNVCQVASVNNLQGKALCFHVDPQGRMLRIEDAGSEPVGDS
jgi:hypothetical protein